jgi:hypothetical protein
MKSRMLAAIAIAACLSLAAAGTASAAAGHPDKHKPKPKPKPAAAAQVSGTRLQTALLPDSAFGDGFTSAIKLNTGGSLLPPGGRLHVPTMDCSSFEDYIYIGGFGDTAGALDSMVNPNPFPDYPNTVVYGIQSVNQFASTQAAATYYSQAFAKYGACQSFTEPNPGDTSPGGGSLDVSTMSVSQTSVGSYHAFQVVELVGFSEAPGVTFYNNVLVVAAGTNIYQFWDMSGTNDEPSPTLMTQLIQRTQKLY